MDLFLEPIIFGDSFEYFKTQIDQSKDKEDDVYIAGPGGNVNAGFAIANYIEAINAGGKKKIRTHVLSNADSINSVIFLSAGKDNRTIVQNSTLFVHEPRFGMMFDVTEEDADEAAEALRIQKNRIADYYVKQIPGLDKDEALSLMNGETTLDADQMLKYGIVSEVKESFDIAAIKSKSYKMGLFDKKNEDKTLQNISLTQGENEVSAVYEGELAENVKLRALGSNDPLNGEFVAENMQYTIENNVIKSIEEIEASNDDNQDDLLEVINSLQDTIEALTERIESIEGQRSTHKPNKKGVENKFDVDPQAQAKAKSRERQIENYKKRSKDQRDRLASK